MIQFNYSCNEIGKGMELLNSENEVCQSPQNSEKRIKFNIKEKIKELMENPSPSTLQKRSPKARSKDKMFSDINKGVSHKIKPIIKKAKDKKHNKAKQAAIKMKNWRMPPRPAINRSPVKPGQKMKVHKLSSPGVSLLESPSSENEGSQTGMKFFTSRSKNAATIQINDTIKLSALKGEVKMCQKLPAFQKKNIGRFIETELEKQISQASLHSSSESYKLDSTLQLPSVASCPSPPKPTRFPSSPLHKKDKSTSKKLPIRTDQTPKSLHISSSPKTCEPVLPHKNAVQQNSIAETPRRVSPRKQVSSVQTPSRVSPHKLTSQSTSHHTPRRSSPRKLTAQQSIASSPQTPKRTSQSSKNFISHHLNESPRSKFTLNGDVCSTLKGYSCLRQNHTSNHDQDDKLPDLDFDLEHLGSHSKEDEILSSLIKENETAEHIPLVPDPSSTRNEASIQGIKKIPNSPVASKKVKYFPVFEPRESMDKVGFQVGEEKDVCKSKRKKFLLKKSDKSQLVIDAGQKNFGPCLCKKCGFLYDAGDPEDEEKHAQFHDFSSPSLKYLGWKNECQVTNMDRMGGRILKVGPMDNVNWWRKVKQVLEYVDKELGFSESTKKRYECKTAFLYILGKMIVGVLIVESINQAYKVVQLNPEKSSKDSTRLICCSNTPQKVSFGVSRIWVLSSHRRRGIATRLIDALRVNIVPYYFLSLNDFAFSDPTPSGIHFAETYTNKSDFLVYREDD